MPYAGTLYKDYFSQNLDDDVAVSNDVPSIRAKRQVSVTTAPASGHPKPEQFQWQRVVTQCWARDEASTSELCFDLRELALRSRRELPTIHKIIIVGEPGRFDDPDDTSPRFQMVFDALFKNHPR